MPYTTDLNDLMDQARQDLAERDHASLRYVAAEIQRYAEEHGDEEGKADADAFFAKVDALDPDCDDFAEQVAELEAEAEVLADSLGVDLPVAPPPAQAAGHSGTIGDGVAAQGDGPFGAQLSPKQMVNYAIARLLKSPVSRTAIHRQAEITNLMYAGLLAHSAFGRGRGENGNGNGDGGGTPLPPPTPAPPAPDREAVLKLIESEVEGGNKAWPRLGTILFEVGATSPAALVAFVLDDWKRNQNQGEWLRKKLINKLGPEIDPLLPPAHDLKRLVTAAKREIGANTRPPA